MPYSRLTHTKDATGALGYTEHGKGHNGAAERNLLVGGVGLLPREVKSYQEQFAELLSKASTQNVTAARRIVISYSKDELPPYDPHSAVTALEIAQDIAQKYYNGFPVAIYVQNDGKGGCLHTHMIACNVNAVTHKGFTAEQTCHSYLRNAVDTIAPQYITPATPKKARNKVTQAERSLHENHGYVWKDDLKRRISQAMAIATSRESYIKYLKLRGVAATYKTSKKFGDYVLYELTDTSKFDGEPPQNLKSKSYKLGADFDLPALDERLQRKKHYGTVSAPAPAPAPAPAALQEKKEKCATSLPEAPTRHISKKQGKIISEEQKPRTEPYSPFSVQITAEEQKQLEKKVQAQIQKRLTDEFDWQQQDEDEDKCFPSV